MFGMPAPTDFDVNFRLLGIPVRINPLFWVLAAVLGWQGRSGLNVLIWIACVFVSILVHEFGHGLTTRWLFRNNPAIVLWAMGGLCFSQGEERDLKKRAAVIIMGPVAGFLLFGLVLGLGLAILGIGEVWSYPIIVHQPPAWFLHMPTWASHSILAAYEYLLFINLIWGVLNLLPIFPLDGGQLTSTFLSMHDRRNGPRRAYIVGMVTAGVLAIYLFTKEETINALFVASLAMLNFQNLQAAHYQQASGGQFEDDDDWWRR